MPERDLVRRLAALAPSTRPIIRSRKRLARLLRDLDDDPVGQDARAAGDGRAVAAGLADDGRGLAGDGRLVDRRDALDDGAVAGDDLAGLDDHDVAAAQLGGGALGAVGSRAVVVVRIARSAAACARPRPSAIASAKLPKITVSHSQTATMTVNQRGSCRRQRRR